LYTAPPALFAVFAVKVQLITVGEDEEASHMPPPLPAKFAMIMQFVNVGDDVELYIAPPAPARYSPPHVLPVNMQSVIVGEESELKIPAPSPPLVAFALNAHCMTVGEADTLQMPPP
jgi:hypothetical protein